MSVPVYLAKLAVKNPSDHRLAKIKRLCDAVGLADKVKPLGTVGEDEVVAIKLHFGEAGNDTYLHPTFVRQVVDCVKATGARPFLTDTCTLYKSTRHNAVDRSGLRIRSPLADMMNPGEQKPHCTLAYVMNARCNG